MAFVEGEKTSSSETLPHEYTGQISRTQDVDMTFRTSYGYRRYVQLTPCVGNIRQNQNQNAILFRRDLKPAI